MERISRFIGQMVRFLIFVAISFLIMMGLAIAEQNRITTDMVGEFGKDVRVQDTTNLSIIIHHTAAEGCQLQAIEDYHRSQWHETGFAYHYLVTDTAVYKVHNENRQTVHAANEFFNKHSIAVCLSGNFEEREPTIGEIKNLYLTVLKLQYEYGIPPCRIFTHGEVSKEPTACCGKYLEKYVNILRKIGERIYE